MSYTAERAAVRRRTKVVLAIAFVASLALVGIVQLFVFGSGDDCGLGTSQVHVVHDTDEEVYDSSDARLAVHRAYEADANDTDRRFTIRDFEPNQSEFNRSYAQRVPTSDDVAEGVPARSEQIDEDEAFYVFRGDGPNNVGATEDGNVFVLTRGYC